MSDAPDWQNRPLISVKDLLALTDADVGSRENGQPTTMEYDGTITLEWDDDDEDWKLPEHLDLKQMDARTVMALRRLGLIKDAQVEKFIHGLPLGHAKYQVAAGVIDAEWLGVHFPDVGC